MTRSQQNFYHPGMPFDPLQYVKRLEAVGFTREQAEIQAESILVITQEQLVTKRDLKEVESQLMQQTELFKRDLKIWFGGMLVTLVVVLSGIQAVMTHFLGH
ncbi:MAG: DUF1640 domain-containing protein [Gammaproteobacteria bacterium]